MITKTLRIKRVYFDAIRNGTKQIEYRADKSYYDWLHSIEKPFKLKLHYQGDETMTVTVSKTKRIKTPAFIDKEIISTPYCWQLFID